MAAVAVTKRSLTPPKQNAGRLATTACLGLVLLAAAVISTPGPASSSPASEEPLVLAFEYCGHRLEMVVEAGKNFHVSADFDKGVMIADGRIQSVVDDNCRLNLMVEYRFKSQSAGSMSLDDLTLKLGKPSGDAYGGLGSPCALSGLWIRRGIDPVPSLVSALRSDYRGFVAAVSELKKVGADGAGAVPRLVEGLQGRIPAPANASYELPVRGLSALALGDIGPAAGAAAPALLEALNDENPRTRIAAANALWKIGRRPAAVPQLVRELTATDWNIRSRALDALEQVGVGAPAAIPALTAMLTADGEPRIRQQAAGVLWQIARSREVIPVHLEGLKSETPWMRAYAATFLGEMGWAARETVPHIVRALLVSPKLQQESMAKALVRIDPDATLTVPELVKAIKNDRQSRNAAASTIGEFGTAALPELSRLLQDGDPDSAHLAVLACYWVGPSSIDFLGDLAENEAPKVREAAAGMLATFENVTSSDVKNQMQLKSVPILIKRFADNDSGVRAAVDDALFKIGSASLPALRTLLEHERREIRDRANDLIRRIEAEVRPTK